MIGHPVINGRSGSELRVSIFPKHSLSNVEQRSYLELPNPMIMVLRYRPAGFYVGVDSLNL